MQFKIVKGDITTLAVDAIVNAAENAVGEVREFLSPASTSALCATADKEEMEVVFCCFSEWDKRVYESIV